MRGTGFQRVRIVEKGTDVILDLEENGDVRYEPTVEFVYLTDPNYRPEGE